MAGLGNISSKDVVEKDIFTLMNATGFSEGKKKKLIKKMLETIENRVIARIDLALKKEEVDEWKELVDEKKDDEAKKYLEERGIDLEKIYLEEAAIYKMQMSNLSKMAKDEFLKQQAEKQQAE